MSMEQQMGSFEDERVGLRNQMQAELARRHGEDLMDFIDKHADAFEGYVKENESILEMFKEDPEEALNKAGQKLYH